MNTSVNKTETRKEKIYNFLDSLDCEIDLAYFSDDVNSFDELTEAIEDGRGFDIDVIYYHTAMEYLMENDSSLTESMELASEYGYQLTDINSELLASLLKSKNVREQYYELEGEINDFFDELEDE